MALSVEKWVVVAIHSDRSTKSYEEPSFRGVGNTKEEATAAMYEQVLEDVLNERADYQGEGDFPTLEDAKGYICDDSEYIVVGPFKITVQL
jgi:hypothetical protein